jgi:hypothetical protein
MKTRKMVFSSYKRAHLLHARDKRSAIVGQMYASNTFTEMMVWMAFLNVDVYKVKGGGIYLQLRKETRLQVLAAMSM